MALDSLGHFETFLPVDVQASNESKEERCQLTIAGVDAGESHVASLANASVIEP